MTAKKTTPKELGERLAYVDKHMATKDDLASFESRLDKNMLALSEQVTGIERELKSIRRELNALAERVENIMGYRKEIDHALRACTHKSGSMSASLRKRLNCRIAAK
jgi:chromosome segregation ATPase